MILVVGATGQLGTAVVRKLVMAGKPVRAFVRKGSRYQHLQGEGIELAFGDLRDPASIAAACQGVDAVIATANAVLPENSGSFEAIEGKGYQDLITSCQEAKVKQFIYISVPVTPHDKTVPNFRYKRLNEERLKNSDLNYTIFRSSLFMDCWFAFIGSAIPGRGAEAPTIERQYWFLKMFMKGVGNLIEGPGVALIPGNRNIVHAFIAVDDVASYLVNAINHPAAERAIVHIGGPEILSWEQVVDIYGKALDRQLRAIYVPGTVFRFQRALLSPFSEAASDIMGLNWLVCYGTPYETKEVASAFGVQPMRAEDFLRLKATFPQSQQITVGPSAA
jgi:NADH dehydrogenase